MNKLSNIDGIIFDMDGVLVNTSQSFRKATQKTVSYMLKNIYKKHITVSLKDIEAMKAIAGFNNDWDVSFVLTDFLNRGIKREVFSTYTKPLPQNIRNDAQYREMLAIFDTFYWGDTLFEKNYKKKSPFSFQPGLVDNETLIIKKDVLTKLSSVYPLGVATGRTSFEMNYVAEKFNLVPTYFKKEYIVVEEDAPFTKPHPAPLLEAKKRMRITSPVYIGDTINDVAAAKSAGMPSIFIGKEKIGDYQLSSINDISEVIDL